MTITLDPKKILIISAGALIVIVAVLLMYNFFFKAAPEEVTAPPVTEAPLAPGREEAPFVPPTKKLIAISQVPVIAPTISADGQKVKYYAKDNGNVYESRFNGTGLTRTSNAVLPGLLKVLWSPDKTQVISIFKDAQVGVRKVYYSYATGASKPLNASIQFVGWSQKGNKIAYQFFDETRNVNSISIADPDGSNFKNIFPTRLRDLIIEWPKADVIAFRSKPSGLAQSVFFGLNPETGSLTKILSNVYGLSALWSPNGEKALFSQTDEKGKNLTLQATDWQGTDTQSARTNTFAEKCVWALDNKTIFCAVPRILPQNAVLPDDYYKNILNISDDFWQINLDTGGQTKIDVGEDISLDATELLINPQEDYLLFINRKDGLLYSLRL